MERAATQTRELFYYHGGPCFVGAAEDQIIVHYETGDVAAVSGRYGQGHYLLSAVHFELDASVYESHIADDLEPEYAKKEREILAVLGNPQYGEAMYKEIEKCLEENPIERLLDEADYAAKSGRC